MYLFSNVPYWYHPMSRSSNVPLSTCTQSTPTHTHTHTHTHLPRQNVNIQVNWLYLLVFPTFYAQERSWKFTQKPFKCSWNLCKYCILYEPWFLPPENSLCVGDHVPWHSSLDASESRIQHMFMTDDVQLLPITTPYGSVNFVQVISGAMIELRYLDIHHFVIMKCSHLANGCTIKCCFIGLILFHYLFRYMDGEFVTLWWQVVQPFTRHPWTKMDVDIPC